MKMKMLFVALMALVCVSVFASEADMAEKIQQYDANVLAAKIKTSEGLRYYLLDGQLAEMVDANFGIIKDSIVNNEIRESGLENEYYFRRVHVESLTNVICDIDQRVRNLNRENPETAQQPIEVTTLVSCTQKDTGEPVEIAQDFFFKKVLEYPNY